MAPVDYSALAEALVAPTALIEAAVLAGCFGLAWLVVRVARGAQPRPQSIWFGKRIIDGVLFPVLALVLAYVAGRLLQEVVPLAVFRVAVPILLSLVAIRVTVRVLRKAFPESRAMRVVERSVSWLVWIGVVLWITGVLPLVLAELDAIQWKLGDSQVSLRNLIEGALSAVAVLVIALWVSAAIEARLLRKTTGDLSVRKIAANAVRALLLFIGLMLALSAAGIDLTALGVLGGAVGVGIGFGLQKLASNYISGFVILAERSLHIGDLVKVDQFEGRVVDIKTRYTVIRALNGREANVPNEMLITQRVENYSRADPNLALTTSVQVKGATDLDALRPSLLEAVSAVPRVLGKPAASLQLSAFTLEGLELTVQFFIDDPGKGTGNVKSDVNEAVLRVFNARGIRLAGPAGAAAPPAAG